MDMKEKMNLQNEADFPEYLENVKDEEEPEMIDYKAMDLTEDEKMEYEMEKARKEEDYGDQYMEAAEQSTERHEK